MEFQIVLKGTPKEIKEQVDSLILYYEGKEKLQNVIKNEKRINENKYDDSDLEPIIAKVFNSMFGL